MPRHTLSHTLESSEGSPASSLKHSHSKREKVRQFLRRVSSIGHRNKQGHEQSLSQTFSAAETQASGSQRDAHSPEPHALIDLTVEPTTTPVKVPRRASTSSSVLRHKAGRLTADDGSSFHSSSPSESSAEDALSITSAHKQHTTSSPHVEPENSSSQQAEVTSAEETTLEASPDQREVADAAAQDAPVEFEANPVPPVFLAEEPQAEAVAPEPQNSNVVAVEHVVPASEDASETTPTQEDESMPASSAQLDGSYVEVNPFDDAYAADTESHASASPALGPVADLDNEEIDNIELNKPDEAPIPDESVPEPESAVVEVNESPECTVEVSTPNEPILSATAEVAPSAIEVQPVEDTETLTTETPITETPYVVVTAPSPVSVPAAEHSTPSLSFSPFLYPSPAHPALALPTTPSPEPEPQFTQTHGPLVSLLHSGLATLKHLLPVRKGAFRWRTPLAYSLVVACYSLTWWLHRRPPMEVPVSYFQMY